MINNFKTKLLLTLIATSIHSDDLMNPTTYSKDLYTEVILDGNYSNDISHPDKFLEFSIGERVAKPSEISIAINTWKTQSDRIKVVEYAESHEGRPLHALSLIHI